MKLNVNRTKSIITLIVTLVVIIGKINYEISNQEITLTKISMSDSLTTLHDQRKDIHHKFDGGVELNNICLPKWDKSTKFAFIHIGKTGGTSFDSSMKKMLSKNRLSTKLYIGNKHFDWSYYESMKGLRQKIHVLTWLRNPIDRAISHYNYMKQDSWKRMF